MFSEKFSDEKHLSLFSSSSIKSTHLKSQFDQGAFSNNNKLHQTLLLPRPLCASSCARLTRELMEQASIFNAQGNASRCQTRPPRAQHHQTQTLWSSAFQPGGKPLRPLSLPPPTPRRRESRHAHHRHQQVMSAHLRKGVASHVGTHLAWKLCSVRLDQLPDNPRSLHTPKQFSATSQLSFSTCLYRR